MDVQTIALDKSKARDLYRAYKTHQHYSDPIDWEIQRTYQLIAQGHVVIQALESIKQAGLGEDRYPKLAIIRATAERCFFVAQPNGSGRFTDNNTWSRETKRNTIAFPANTFAGANVTRDGRAIIPLIPVHLRPKRGLASYHILWEADWQSIPRDPYLLRRIGKGDLWLVCAAWDLTEVERAAMATRIRVA